MDVIFDLVEIKNKKYRNKKNLILNSHHVNIKEIYNLLLHRNNHKIFMIKDLLNFIFSFYGKKIKNKKSE